MDVVYEQINTLSQSVKESDAPNELKDLILVRIDQLSKVVNSPMFLSEFDRLNRYADWIKALPWNKRTQDNLDLEHAKSILDKNHFGLTEIKDRILEYLSVMKLKREQGESEDVMRAPILCFVGLVGTGKTTIAISIAEALGREFARIPFGGMESPLDLRGQSRMQFEAEPGKIIKVLRMTKTRNPVVLLDEIDRVTDSGRASIMGVLVELLDPEQNHAYVDHYIDYPFDLSEVMFIATANNTHHIATAVLDRLEPISMPSYSDQEKIVIGREYLFPRVLKLAGIPKDKLNIEENVWPLLVRPLGFDAGMRTLERTIEGVVRKVARLIIEGKVQTFTLTVQNVKEYIPQ